MGYTVYTNIVILDTKYELMKRLMVDAQVLRYVLTDTAGVLEK